MQTLPYRWPTIQDTLWFRPQRRLRFTPHHPRFIATRRRAAVFYMKFEMPEPVTRYAAVPVAKRGDGWLACDDVVVERAAAVTQQMRS